MYRLPLRRSVILFGMIVAGLVVVLVARVQAGAAPRLWLNPAASTLAAVGDTAVVTMTASNVAGFNGVDLELRYDPAVVEVVPVGGGAVSPGDCIPPDGFFIRNDISPAGQITYIGVLLGGTPPAYCSNGAAADTPIGSVTFRCLVEDGSSTAVSYVDPILANVSEDVTPVDVRGATITCGAAATSVPPTATNTPRPATATPTATNTAPTATPTTTSTPRPATATPTSTATNTAPTATPAATSTPRPATATPTSTATNTAPTTTPAATSTPQPATVTPTSTATSAAPTATPAATSTPRPVTATPTATAISAAPTATLAATGTPLPTATPSATPTSAAPEPRLWLDPAVSTLAGVGSTAVVTLTTADIPGFNAVDLMLRYDPAVVEVVANADGSAITAVDCIPPDSFYISNNVEPAGQINYVGTMLGGTAPAYCSNGIGYDTVIGTVLFRCLVNDGSSTAVDYVDPVLASVGTDVTPPTVQGAAITCGAGPSSFKNTYIPVLVVN